MSNINLIRDITYSRINESTPWTGNQKQAFKDNDRAYIKLWSSTNSSWARYQRQTISTVEPGEYRVTAFLKKNTEKNPKIAWRFDNKGANVGYDLSVTVDSYEWKKYEFPIYISKVTWENEPFVIFVPLNNIAISTETAIDVAEIRLERDGDKMAYLDNNGVTYLWNKIKALFNKSITGLKVSGRTITYTKGDGTTGTITTQDTTYSVMKGATASADGANGLVPAPTKGNEGKFLKADGTWVTPPNTTYSPATQSANGLMSASDKKKLDGVAANANNYVHPTTSGNKHIPSGGVSGQILRWSADGTAVWGADKDTTYNVFTAPTETAAGKQGLVPAPPANTSPKILSANDGWVNLFFNTNDTDKDKVGINIILATDSTAALASGISIASSTSSKAGVMSAADKTKLDALPTNATLSSTYALKSEITNMYKYMGSVTDASKLPTAGQRTGDVYNIETASKYGGAGMNVAWNGSAWDPLGEIFTITAITNAEINAICV